VKDVLLRSDGAFDDDIQIYINGVDRVQREESDSKKLSEGDTVTFMMLVAGG
jgi:molybdopterin converting factor small subunit